MLEIPKFNEITRDDIPKPMRKLWMLEKLKENMTIECQHLSKLIEEERKAVEYYYKHKNKIPITEEDELASHYLFVKIE
jgi:hypothetical protein